MYGERITNCPPWNTSTDKYYTFYFNGFFIQLN